MQITRVNNAICSAVITEKRGRNCEKCLKRVGRRSHDAGRIQPLETIQFRDSKTAEFGEIGESLFVVIDNHVTGVILMTVRPRYREGGEVFTLRATAGTH